MKNKDKHIETLTTKVQWYEYLPNGDCRIITNIIDIIDQEIGEKELLTSKSKA